MADLKSTGEFPKFIGCISVSQTKATNTSHQITEL